MNRGIFRISVLLMVVCWLTVSDLQAQPTEFTFQGSLKNAGTNANGNFDFQFALFDSLSGGSQIGSTIALNSIAVSEGFFSVKLDFGNQFTGANRFLEIRVRQTGGGAFTVLSPRQTVNSAPYSVKSLNAENATTANNALSLGGVTANQFVQTTDSRLSDERNPLPNSPNYIQNGTTQQTSSNFNISGTGTANILNATTQFNIGGQKILSISGLGNLFAGVGAGSANTSGDANSFFGHNVGSANTTGFANSFFGQGTGFSNTIGSLNSFFGRSAGTSNTSGNSNSFFGMNAGNLNTTGTNNSFFGMSAGFSNTIGINNSFFGRDAGVANTTGNSNSFFGTSAGDSNTTASNNSFFGRDAGRANTIGSDNSFFGRNAGQNNTTGALNSFFGANSGSSNTTGTLNSFFGAGSGSSNATGIANSVFGVGAAGSNTTGSNNSFFGFAVGNNNTTGDSNSFFGVGVGDHNTTGSNNSFFGSVAGLSNTIGNNLTIIGSNADVGINNLDNAAAIGFRAFVSQSNSLVLGSINGVNGATADTNVGIGTTAPQSKLEVRNGEITSTGLGGGRFAANNPNNQNARVLFDWFNDGTNDFPRIRYGGSGEGATNGFLIQGPSDSTKLAILNSGNIGIGTITPQDRLEVNGIIRVITLGAAGSTSLCRNASNQISTCSSSIRYKTDINSFNSGLNLIRRLRPVSFRWLGNNQTDFGLVAEEVGEIEPLLTTQNEKGETEGVKYDRLGVVLVNAVNEQQTQIQTQQKQIDEQKEIIKSQQDEIEKHKKELEALKKFICDQNKTADFCQLQN